MKENLIQRTFRTLTEAFQNCLTRFPVTVGFIFALTFYLLYLVNVGMRENVHVVLGYYFSVGTLLSLSLHLWSEEIKSQVKKWLIHIIPHLLFIADALYLYSLPEDGFYTEIGIAHAAGVLALLISIFFLSFTKEKNDIPSWNFASAAINSFITAYVIGGIMTGGICLLIYSLHMLFDVDVDNKCYPYTAIICCAWLSLLLFIGMLPKGADKHNTRPSRLTFLNSIIRYLFLPLIGGYLLVLYVYAGRILMDWELPTGWVSWLVIVLMIGCIAIEFGLYPTRMERAKATDERIARWLPALILPLLLLMTIGIIRRFNDYGITVNRLYLITLNGWFYLVCIGLVVLKARRISWIPISFAVIFLLTSVLPVNYASITQKTLYNEVAEELKQSKQINLPLSSKQYGEWLASLPEETAAQINNKLKYLKDWFGAQSISALTDKDISFYSWEHSYRSTIDAVSDPDTSLSYTGQADAYVSVPIVEGYSNVVFTSGQISDSIPAEYAKKCLFPIPLNSHQANDTVYVDFTTLKTLNKNAYGEMPPTSFKCNSDNSRFVLTRFSLNNYKQGDKKIWISIDGYLFKK